MKKIINRFGRYRSTKQISVETGSLMRHYRETLTNISAIQNNRDLPPFCYSDYKTWNFINAFRTTPVECALNYIEDTPNIKIPVCTYIMFIIHFKNGIF